MSEHNEIVTPGLSHPERPLPLNVFIVADEHLVKYPPIMEATRHGIEDIVAMMKTPLRVKVVGSEWRKGEYGSTKWFTDHARRIDRKLVYNDLHRDLAEDPNRKSTPHLGYMLLLDDMTVVADDGRAMNFIFGHTDKEIGQSVQSVYRFIKGDISEGEIATVTRHIARHEFGHLVGLDNDTIRNQDKRGGIYENHCANECSMRQVVSVQESVALAKSLQGKSNAGFCVDCSSYLSKR